MITAIIALARAKESCNNSITNICPVFTDNTTTLIEDACRSTKAYDINNAPSPNADIKSVSVKDEK